MNLKSRILMSMTQGLFELYLLNATASFGIYDLLSEGEMTTEELQEKTGIRKDLLRRILRPVLSLGFVTEKDGKIALTELGEPLCSDSPNSLRGFLDFNAKMASEYWKRMEDALRSGKYPYELLEEDGFFASQTEQGEQYQSFNHMMQSSTKTLDVPMYLSGREEPLSPRTVQDIGGGEHVIIMTRAGKPLSQRVSELPQRSKTVEPTKNAA